MSIQFYLNETNPEIYQVVPRPGGIAKIEETPKKSKAGKKSFAELASQMSTTERVSTASLSKSRTSKSRSIFDVSKEGQEKKEEREPCRDYRVHQTASTFPWSAELDEFDPELQKELPNPFQDSVDMLAIVVSTVMLLAAEHGNIPEDHLLWTLSYLECILDEFGNYPPNVRSMLNHINNVTGGKLVSFNARTDDELNEIATGKATSISFAPAEES